MGAEGPESMKSPICQMAIGSWVKMSGLKSRQKPTKANDLDSWGSITRIGVGVNMWILVWVLLGSLLLPLDSGAVIVPDVVDTEESAAKTALENVGLLWAITLGFSTDIDQGNVISQSPVAGSNVSDNSTIDLVVSKGPQSQALFDLAFWGVMKMFLLGTYLGLFIKLTNRS